MSGEEQGEFRIGTEGDIVQARKIVRDQANRLGFGITDVTRIVTAVSELARNVFRYAGTGVMRWFWVSKAGKDGLEVTFEDQGPGIANVDRAMGSGFTTGGGLGMGLPGSKRLMDEMDVQSEVGKGTVVTVRKWLR